jgi:hypothetical protein
MADWKDEYETMIEDCINRSEKLSDWESDFIQSLSEQLDDGKIPSSKQINKLNDIWERVT